jgi:hypothetical protein
MKPVECKIARQEASGRQKVTFGGHRDILLASHNYPQYNGTAHSLHIPTVSSGNKSIRIKAVDISGTLYLLYSL